MLRTATFNTLAQLRSKAKYTKYNINIFSIKSTKYYGFMSPLKKVFKYCFPNT